MTLPELSRAYLQANQNRLLANTRRAYGYDLDLLASAAGRVPVPPRTP